MQALKELTQPFIVLDNATLLTFRVKTTCRPGDSPINLNFAAILRLSAKKQLMIERTSNLGRVMGYSCNDHNHKTGDKPFPKSFDSIQIDHAVFRYREDALALLRNGPGYSTR